jgi:putative peptide zinc metalloprotease protein
MYATLALLAAVAAAVCLVPLPHRVYCTLELQPREAKRVYVDVPGKLEEVFIHAGDQVSVGQPLARLSSIELTLSIAEYERQRNSLRAQLNSLHRLSHLSPQAGLQIGQVEASLASVEEQLAKKTNELKSLDLTSPASGTVLPPPEESDRPSADGELPGWSGTPLEPRNIGAYLTESVLFCQVGDPKKMEALMVVDQEDVEYLRLDQRVDIKLDQLPADTFQGRINFIAAEPLKVSPRHLSNKAGGELATKTDDSGVERPLSTSYQVLVPLDDEESVLRIGLRGRGRIHAAPLTLGQRLMRFVSQTFNFRL